MVKRITKLLLLIASFFLMVECDNRDEHAIPTVWVDFNLNVYDPEFQHLQIPGNAQEVFAPSFGYLTLGYDNSGIIVYNNGDEFYAFDRTCPYDFPTTVQVELDGNLAICPTCGSVYVLPSFGTPSTDGPAVRPLKQYRSSYNYGSGDLHVYN